ncbi:hypothetical protein BV22DRAFT_1025832 [Leucogyrophana mollusca]|uniref:Uncharacterized protein n=1 Tax=Leucogyrophana mollusca TaxID=85980 RepID=A0ACB8AXP3_9AGAM|nr:hypothetical protein BV22DRAFT_1025832 [Leucogyrophana mollusca]
MIHVQHPMAALDPNLQLCPNFASVDFADALLGLSLEEAAAHLTVSWTRQNDTKKAEWAALQDRERLLREDADRLDRKSAALLTAQRANELQEIERKLPKIHPFNPTKLIGSNLPSLPSSFALERLKKFEYIELWYCSPEGCADAAETQRTSSNDTFGISCSDSSFMVLKPVASVRASRKAIRDEDLTWDQMQVRGTTFLTIIKELPGWSHEHYTTLALFWYRISNHELRTRPNGQRILIHYQARARHAWHMELD